jgi:protein kinase N
MPNSFHSKAEIEEAREAVKKEIRKEMKIKEGAEKLREATSDKKSLAHVQTIVKKANNRLQELQQELNELSTYLLVSNSLGGDVIDGEFTCIVLDLDLWTIRVSF